PIRGIIPEQEILEMVEDLKEEGALVNYKKNPDGTESPYEINVTYMDALNKRLDKDSTRVDRFLLAHSILLTLPGVPAVYVQSILGSRNDYEGVAKTGMNRSINRKKYTYNEIEKELTDVNSLRHSIFTELTKIIQIRKTEPLFHPNVDLDVIDLGEELFAFKRTNAKSESIYVLHNLTNHRTVCRLEGKYQDILTKEQKEYSETISLDPYQFLWLKPLN
ncbi:sugar phosphorylase, partial [Priestia megaterium]